MKNGILSVLLLIVILTLSSCMPALTPAPTPTMEPATATLPVPTATSTPLPPSIHVSAAVECTGGPGSGYRSVASIPAGAELKVVGKDSSGQYWIVMEPQTGKGCWIAAGQTSGQGDTSTLPELIPGPTIVAAPAAPANLKAVAVCGNEGMYTGAKITITWEDRSDNETGFELLMNRSPHKQLDKDTTQYSEFIRAHAKAQAFVYWLRAVNENGKSAIVEASVSFYCG